eukprot:CAMPEP_0179221126 /NCGR_PEP_ID=MMETSP0797-20121207/6015_1 /TAXON_ID=47934 /ORGANISM="Dinophysis acuminata, Strain DAEP01" /LENGTH=612 /DNA_ID=CAMNT_0020927869 /DNA_START=104 /DNA_END=1943 /DNA_ORIENTATION=-
MSAVEDAQPLVDTGDAPRPFLGRRTKNGLASIAVLCVCVVVAGSVGGCGGSIFGFFGGGGDDKKSRSWTVLSDVGVSESAANVGNAGERTWIIKTPDSWSTQKLKTYNCEEGEVKWRGKPTEGGIAGVIFVGTKTALEKCLKANPRALYVEEDIQVEAIDLDLAVPSGSDPDAAPGRRLAKQAVDGSLWGLDRLDSTSGLDRSYDNRGLDGQGVHVYVLDTGIRYTHSDFGGRAIPSFDATVGFPPRRCGRNDRSCALDRQGHGTHCAGTVAGRTFGVAKQAKVYGVKVLGDSGSGSEAGIIEAIDFVAAEGQRPGVISMSLGCPQPCQSRAEHDAIQAATRQGIVVVVAAGNSGRTGSPDACDYAPASIPFAITVGSITDTSDRRSDFSNVGRCIDLFAPGSAILSASHRSNSGSVSFSGTSMACPHVSGAAALLLGRNPSLSAQQVTDLLVGGSLKGKVQDARGSANRLLNIQKFPVGGGAAPSPPPPTEPDEQIRFVTELSQGTCRGTQFRGKQGIPINDKALCEAAARVLGVPDETASITRRENGRRVATSSGATGSSWPRAQRTSARAPERARPSARGTPSAASRGDAGAAAATSPPRTFASTALFN